MKAHEPSAARYVGAKLGYSPGTIRNYMNRYRKDIENG